MSKIEKLYDTSSELLVQRWAGGIKLIRPSQIDVKNPHALSVLNMLNMPFNVYLLDGNQEFLNYLNSFL